MRRPSAKGQAQALWSFVSGSRGDCVRLVLSWTVAGGVAGGGILVGVLTIFGVLDPGVQLLVGDVLFLAGAAIGLFHGSLLAYVGRPVCLSRGAALRHVLLATVLAVPVLAIGWLVTASISLTAALRVQMHVSWLVFGVGGWFLGLGLCAWAALEGWRALKTAVRRWREGRVRPALGLLPHNHFQPHCGGGEAGS